MNQPRLSVLFLCTGNSARSQLAEALLRDLSRRRVEVASAGTSPDPLVHPLAIEVLRERYGIDASGLEPKPLEAVITRHFDFVITVCDAAAEACPLFPNADRQMHWSVEDPAAKPSGPGQRRAFEQVARELTSRIRLWMSLPEIAKRISQSSPPHAQQEHAP